MWVQWGGREGEGRTQDADMTYQNMILSMVVVMCILCVHV